MTRSSFSFHFLFTPAVFCGNYSQISRSNSVSNIYTADRTESILCLNRHREASDGREKRWRSSRRKVFRVHSQTRGLLLSREYAFQKALMSRNESEKIWKYLFSCAPIRIPIYTQLGIKITMCVMIP